MYVTLNISATSIRLLSVKGREVKKWGNAPLTPGLVRDGLILQPKVVGTAIDALFKSAEVPKEQVITSLTGLSFTYRILSLPRIKPALVDEAIQRAARKEMALPLEELYLSWQTLSSQHDEQDFFVAGVPRNLIDALVQTLAEAGVKPYITDLKPLALARAANREDALIVALEPDCFDIVLVANGMPVIMHTMTPRGEEARIEDNVQRLANELSKTVEFYNSSHPDNLLSATTPLLLTGELSGDATTSELIQAEIEYPVEPLIPPLKFPPDLPVAVYASNMGLALKKVPPKTTTGFHDVNLNIVSGKYRAKAHLMPLRYMLLPLAFIIAIGLLFPMYQVKSQADAETARLQTELGELSQELRQARLASIEAEQIEDTIDEIAADVETLKQEHQYILREGRDFTNNLRLVTDALPPRAYFTSIDIGTEQITVEGEIELGTDQSTVESEVDAAFVVISYATALEGQRAFSEVCIAEIDKGTRTETEITETTVYEFEITATGTVIMHETTEIETTEIETTVITFVVVISK